MKKFLSLVFTLLPLLVSSAGTNKMSQLYQTTLISTQDLFLVASNVGGGNFTNMTMNLHDIAYSMGASTVIIPWTNGFITRYATNVSLFLTNSRYFNPTNLDYYFDLVCKDVGWLNPSTTTKWDSLWSSNIGANGITLTTNGRLAGTIYMIDQGRFVFTDEDPYATCDVALYFGYPTNPVEYLTPGLCPSIHWGGPAMPDGALDFTDQLLTNYFNIRIANLFAWSNLWVTNDITFLGKIYGDGSELTGIVGGSGSSSLILSGMATNTNADFPALRIVGSPLGGDILSVTNMTPQAVFRIDSNGVVHVLGEIRADYVKVAACISNDTGDIETSIGNHIIRAGNFQADAGGVYVDSDIRSTNGIFYGDGSGLVNVPYSLTNASLLYNVIVTNNFTTNVLVTIFPKPGTTVNIFRLYDSNGIMSAYVNPEGKFTFAKHASFSSSLSANGITNEGHIYTTNGNIIVGVGNAFYGDGTYITNISGKITNLYNLVVSNNASAKTPLVVWPLVATDAYTFLVVDGTSNAVFWISNRVAGFSGAATDAGGIDLYATNNTYYTRLTIPSNQLASYIVYLPNSSGTLFLSNLNIQLWSGYEPVATLAAKQDASSVLTDYAGWPTNTVMTNIQARQPAHANLDLWSTVSTQRFVRTLGDSQDGYVPKASADGSITWQADATGGGSGAMSWDISNTVYTVANTNTILWSNAIAVNTVVDARDIILVSVGRTNTLRCRMDGTWRRDGASSSLLWSEIYRAYTNGGSEDWAFYLTNENNHAVLRFAGPAINETNRVTVKGLVETVSIATNEWNLGQLSFSNAAVAATEGTDASVLVYVWRTNGSAGTVSVDVRTVDGTADSTDDYTATNATFTWADGETDAKPFSVAILDDADDEADTETFSIILSNFVGAAHGPITNVTVTITDDDTAVYAGPLDILSTNPTVLASYSLNRRLTTNYASTNLFRLRRGGDNATLDIGYDPTTGIVYTNNIYTFCGTSNGYVSIIYDQSGNGYDLTNLSVNVLSGQPWIYDVTNASPIGLVTLSNGAVACKFPDVTGFGMENRGVAYPENPIITIVSGRLVAHDNSTSTRYVCGAYDNNEFSCGFSTNGVDYIAKIHSGNAVTIQTNANWAGTNATFVWSTIWQSGAACTSIFNSATNTSLNAGAITPGTGIVFGGQYGTGHRAKSRLSEFIIVPYELSGEDLHKLRTNTAVYYGAPW